MQHWLIWSATLRLAYSQITLAEQSGVSGVCHLAPSAASVLPNGFHRSIAEPYSTLQASHTTQQTWQAYPIAFQSAELQHLHR